MLEIIILYFLCKNIGDRVERKGYERGIFIFFTVLSWIIFEILGIVFGYSVIKSSENIFQIIPFALIGGAVGYLIMHFITLNLASKR
jgi:hypothetical protein